jgi:hypothetical protein
MLYKLGQTKGVFDSIKPVAFQNVGLEKHLENLLAENLLEVLFEAELMPIFQERPWQAEADIYALNRKGDVVIFELKRAGAGGSAVHQALRYCEEASHWQYETLQTMLAKYQGKELVDLQQEHQNSFVFEKPLEKSVFNARQHLIVVGSAGDDDLVGNVDYWKSKGIWLDFIPYRVYQIGDEHYFEFFSIPYDRHLNPAGKKGVLFDTNRSYNEDDIWYMCENGRVAAFGRIKGVVYSLGKGDLVFLYHKGEGIVAAGEVKSDVKADAEKDGLYRELKWLTPVPVRGREHKAMTPSRIREVLGHDFWWAITIKRPHLSMDEAKTLLEALKKYLACR